MCVHVSVYVSICLLLTESVPYFEVMHCLGHGFISLESIQSPCHYIGVNNAGDCKPYLNAGISEDEKFYVIPVQPVSHYMCQHII